jgi:hypothetical protein
VAVALRAGFRWLDAAARANSTDTSATSQGSRHEATTDTIMTVDHRRDVYH